MTSKLPCRRRRSIFGFKLEAWRPKNVSYFSLCMIWCGFRNCKSFLWVVNAISSEKRLLISMPFLLTFIDVRKVKIFRLLNPNWLIQISRAAAACKDTILQCFLSFNGFFICKEIKCAADSLYYRATLADIVNAKLQIPLVLGCTQGFYTLAHTLDPRKVWPVLAVTQLMYWWSKVTA